MTTKVIIPSNMSFSASLMATYFQFFGETETGERRPVEVSERKIRGTTNIFHADPASALQLDKNNPAQPNGQRIDVAYLGTDEVALVVKGALMVHSNSLRAHNISDADFEAEISRFVALMKERGGYAEIARRFTLNIARGIFLWDNAALGQSTVKVSVEGLGSHTFACNPLRQNVNEFSFDVFDGEGRKYADALAARIEAALSEEQPYALRIDIEARVEAAPAVAVKPSQLWVRKDDNSDDPKSRYLASLTPAGTNIKQAVLGPEKVTAAIKRIDNWYGQPRAVSVSVYATDLMRATAHRTGNSLKSPNPTFYFCLKHLPELIGELEQDQPASEHALFTLAMLIQGGVFGTKAEAQGVASKGGRKGRAAKKEVEETAEAEE